MTVDNRDYISPRVADSMIPAGPRPSRLSLGTDVATPRDGISPLPSPARSDSPGDDSVRVFVRIRPLNDREASSSAVPVATARGPSSVVLDDPSRGPDPYVVAVDRVLDADASQEAVFDAAGAPLVDHCLAGFNTCVFAYGQTGSGKTHTMLGDVSRGPDGALAPGAGLAPRVFDALFAAIGRREQRVAARYSVRCSFLEIYNEEVTDLLAPTAPGALQIRDGDVKRGVYVQGLSEAEALNADDVLALIAAGAERRRVAGTAMNDRSSRSHTVFTATVECVEPTSASSTPVNGGSVPPSVRRRTSKINLIDLAGSERVGRSGAAGATLTEAKNINRSLVVLGRVISALAERQARAAAGGRGGSAPHVPYRDSRLTFLLQESLGGNSRTAVIANVTPAADSAGETYSTLAFAAGAKKVRCRAVVNEERGGDARALAAENARLGRLVADLQAQVDQARALFDQNNGAITALRAEQSLLRRDLGEAKATAARLGEEAAALRADNALLGAALEGEEEARGRVMAEAAAAREVAGREAEVARRAVEEAATLREDLDAARAAAAGVAAEVAEARAARTAAEAMLEEARAEVRRVQKEAREESAAAAAREEGLRREAEALRDRAAEAAAEADRLRKELSGEQTSVQRYKRMVGEIGRLVDWAQAAAPAPSAALAAAAAAGARGPGSAPAKPSAAALAALRVARMSLGAGVGTPRAATTAAGVPPPLSDATNTGSRPSSRPSSARGLPAHKDALTMPRPLSAAS